MKKNIEIVSHQKRTLNRARLRLEAADYAEIDLREMYKDSCISQIFIHKSCIEEVNSWVEKSLETEGPVVEIGGMFLGYYQEKKEGYETVLEKFFPVSEVEEQSSVFLNMGKGLGLAYGKIMDDYPDLGLLAWFHTHPGHGPYLSNTDLTRTHEVFFKEAYQLALVLDSLTDDFQTGIFTRKSNMQMNNAIDANSWVPWKSLAANS